MSLRIGLLAAVFSSAIVADGPVAVRTAPTLVEIWRGGDDGLTLRLTDSITKAFKSSPDFELSSGKKEGTLIVLIPTHVQWTRLGWRPFARRTRISYRVEFKMLGKSAEPVDTLAGSCRDDHMANCAAEIVMAAKGVVSKGRQNDLQSQH